MKEKTIQNIIVALITVSIVCAISLYVAYEGKTLTQNLCKEQFGPSFEMKSWDSEHVNCGPIIKVPEETKEPDNTPVVRRV